MIISIFASIGAQNLGDELILKNEINLLEKKYLGENIKFYVFTYDLEDDFIKKSNVEYVEYFPIGIKQPKNLITNVKNFLNFKKIVKQSDFIVVGGGGIIYDEEHQKTFTPLNQWLFRSNFFKKLNKKVLFFSIGINIKNSSNLEKIKKIFSGNCEIHVRDKSSLELLANLGIEAKRTMDPVFCDNINLKELKGDSNFEISLKPSFLQKEIDSKIFKISDLEEIDFSGKIVGIGFRTGYLTNENENIEKIIEFILKNNGKIILVPHSFHKTDEKANDYLFLDKFAQKYDLEICKNMTESYEIYIKGKINFCLAMRLHSIILSQVYKIPFIGFTYSKKTSEILRELK